jgi:HK97 family phage major capsid protein
MANAIIQSQRPTATSVSAYRVSEGSKITSSQPTTSAISLTSKTLGVIVPFSRRLLRNATPNVVDMILMLAGEAFATLRDEWAIKGLASGEGVFRHASVPELVLGTGDTTYAKIEAADLLDALNKIDANVPDANLRWVLHRSVFNVLRAQRIQMGAATGASGAEVLYPQEFLFAGYGADLPATMWNIPIA